MAKKLKKYGGLVDALYSLTAITLSTLQLTTHSVSADPPPALFFVPTLIQTSENIFFYRQLCLFFGAARIPLSGKVTCLH